ncbi:CoA-transferase family III [Paracoccus isoporae]|uniref:CoA-transferase family III n=2 Tax=Paracoccus isoporae TaxID=591205 RepID=A0A1G7HHL1_9RHOB|nr:CoA-transferase family III [Paracoccus isoporae]
MIMGPSCRMLIGRLDAEVKIVEPPQGGKTRELDRMGSPMFPQFDRGKKSMTINVKTEARRKHLASG